MNIFLRNSNGINFYGFELGLAVSNPISIRKPLLLVMAIPKILSLHMKIALLLVLELECFFLTKNVSHFGR